MNKFLTSAAGLAAAGTVGYFAVGNVLGSAVAMAAAGLILHAKFSAPKNEQFGDTVRGTQVDNKTKRRRAPSDQVALGGIAIPRECEPQNFLVVGAPGSGKTVAWLSIMDVARARGQRAIVYDPTGEFVAHYYRAGQDVILSPIDTRSALWSPWAEGRTPFDYENLAQALIPDGTGNEQFWTQAARAIFQAALASTNNLPELIELIFAAEQDDLLAAIQAQGLGGLTGPPNMLASTRGVAATYIRSLAYLPAPGPAPFSIRDWVKDEKDSWLFVSSREDCRKSIRPLISMWLGLAVQSAMSLSPDRNRRLWMILDELPTLQKLPALDIALAGGRKYGITVLVGIQAISQTREIYGRDAAASILSHPSTRLTLRVGDSETAEFLSKSLGDRHTIRKVSSESNTGGSGSTSEQHSIEAAVLPSEILALPNLVGYLRVPNDPVIKKIKLVPRDRPTLAVPYADRSLATPPAMPPGSSATAIPSAPGVVRGPSVPGADAPDVSDEDLPDKLVGEGDAP